MTSYKVNEEKQTKESRKKSVQEFIMTERNKRGSIVPHSEMNAYNKETFIDRIKRVIGEID